MRRLFQAIAALPLVVNIGLVLALLGLALPMLGIGGSALGAVFLVLAILLIAGGILPRVWPRIRPWVERGKRIRLRLPFALAPNEVGSRPAKNLESGEFGIHTITLGTDERPLVGDHELKDKVYERRSFGMAEFARKIAPSGEAQAVIRDRRFYDCRIYGPIVFGPLSRDEINRIFVGCEWIEEQPIVFWPIAEARDEYIGAVRLEDCRFEGCRLSRVGIITNP